MKTASMTWTWIGLAVALLGIPGITFLAGRIAPPGETTVLLRELSVLALTGLLLLIVIKGEKLPLTSIGLRFDRLRRSALHCLLLTIAMIALVFATMALLSAVGIEQNTAQSIAPSLPLMTLTVVRAGLAEEIFFRGFALERIEAMSGSKSLAIFVTLGAFALFHYRGGLFGILLALSLGGLLTAYYVWKRDLVPAIGAHFLIDFIPNVLLAPPHS